MFPCPFSHQYADVFFGVVQISLGKLEKKKHFALVDHGRRRANDLGRVCALWPTYFNWLYCHFPLVFAFMDTFIQGIPNEGSKLHPLLLLEED